MGNSLQELREQFIEQVGMIAQADGLPRIAGRLMGLMIFDDKPYSFSEIAIELQVSRGSISSSVRLLIDLGVIDRIVKPGDRQDYFQLTDEPYTNILKGAILRATRARNSINRIVEAIPEEERVTRERLEKYEDFYSTLVDALQHTAK